MKLKREIAKGLFTFALVASGGVWADEEHTGQVVYCKAVIQSFDGRERVSVTLPPTEGYYDCDGYEVTIWNVGNVPCGGVADSWHSEKGPGAFTAHNTGNVGAYVYVTTGWEMEYPLDLNGRYPHVYNIGNEIFKLEGSDLRYPCSSVRELRQGERYVKDKDTYSNESYAAYDLYSLAFTTDTLAKIPTWHLLDKRYLRTRNETGWCDSDDERSDGYQSCGAYMGYVPAGDYLTFDLKFYAPHCGFNNETVFFTFCLEAASFPLWEHDMR